VASTRAIVENAGIVLSFGVDNLKPFLSGARNAQERRLILCTPETATVNYEYIADTILVGSLSATADRLREKLPAIERTGVVQALATKRLETMMGILETLPVDHDPRYTNALDFLLQLNARLDASHSIVVDTGSHALWVALYLRLRQRQRYVVSSRLGTMGFSIPAAIAMQLEDPGRKAIAICGDGCFAMVGMELATAVENRLPIVIIVVNNGVLQNVMAQQAEPYGTKLMNPDFVAFARAFGAVGEVADGEADADAIIARALAHRDGPYLIDLRCSPALLAPLNKWKAV
jgi:acetolactate synthase-1/2/3 large subunit